MGCVLVSLQPWRHEAIDLKISSRTGGVLLSLSGFSEALVGRLSEWLMETSLSFPQWWARRLSPALFPCGQVWPG